MSLLDIRTAVVKETGRTDLIGVDGSGNPDYTVDNGIDDFINRAQMVIVDRAPWIAPATVAVRDVNPEMFQVSLPNLVQPRKVWFLAFTEQTWSFPHRRTMDYLRETYGKPFNLIDGAQPVDWAHNDIDISPDSDIWDDIAILIDPDFNVDAYWSTDLPAELVLAGGKFTAAAPMSSGSAIYTTPGQEALALNPDMVALLAAGYEGVMRVKILADITEGSIAFVVIDAEAITQISREFLPDDSGWIQFDFDFPQNPVVMGLAVQPGFKGSVSYQQVYLMDAPGGLHTGNIIFLPPADIEYKINVEGKFYPEPLEAPSATNWLTIWHSRLLILATRYVIALSLANEQEADNFSRKLDKALLGPTKDRVRGDIYRLGGGTMKLQMRG